MSDRNNTPIECGRHGLSYATFVCQHLVRGRGLGFNQANEPDDPCPRAWCDACDAVLLEEGAWNDYSEAVAGVTVLCAWCYDESRQRNEHASQQSMRANMRTVLSQ